MNYLSRAAGRWRRCQRIHRSVGVRHDWPVSSDAPNHGSDRARRSCKSFPFFITGETGTGKEEAAKAIHERSEVERVLSCRSIAPTIIETLIESELFGHQKGSFTGAENRRHPGLSSSERTAEPFSSMKSAKRDA